MFSIVERATSRTFVRVLVIVMAATLLCGSFPVLLAARDVERKPCEMPGDGEDVNGYKNFEFEGSSAGESALLPSVHPARDSQAVKVHLRTTLAMIVVNFYLAARK
jgi:hypothetical protein